MTLNGKRVAILVAEGFEQSEMVEPRKALHEAGADTAIASPARAKAEDFDALLLPGDVAHPDELRTNPRAVQFVKSFVESGKAGRRHLPRCLDTHRGRRG